MRGRSFSLARFRAHEGITYEGITPLRLRKSSTAPLRLRKSSTA